MKLDLSVVIATYNRARFVSEALGSVAGQTVTPLEVVVVDDGSTDDTEARVRACSQSGPPVVYERLPQNRGAAIARNLGVELARGDVVVFLDSDDLLEPAHHARVLQVLQTNPEIALFACDAFLVNGEGRMLRGGRTYWEIQSEIKGMTITGGTRNLVDVFFLSTLFSGCAVRREVFTRVGGLRQELFPLEDYDFTLRVAEGGCLIHHENAPLARYRMHAENSSGPARAAFVQQQRLRCILEALARSRELRELGRRATRRVGDVRRELALTLLKGGQYGGGAAQLVRALGEDPSGVADLARIAARRLGVAISRRAK